MHYIFIQQPLNCIYYAHVKQLFYSGACIIYFDWDSSLSRAVLCQLNDIDKLKHVDNCQFNNFANELVSFLAQNDDKITKFEFFLPSTFLKHEILEYISNNNVIWPAIFYINFFSSVNFCNIDLKKNITFICSDGESFESTTYPFDCIAIDFSKYQNSRNYRHMINFIVSITNYLSLRFYLSQELQNHFSKTDQVEPFVCNLALLKPFLRLSAPDLLDILASTSLSKTVYVKFAVKRKDISREVYEVYQYYPLLLADKFAHKCNFTIGEIQEKGCKDALNIGSSYKSILEANECIAKILSFSHPKKSVDLDFVFLCCWYYIKFISPHRNRSDLIILIEDQLRERFDKYSQNTFPLLGDIKKWHTLWLYIFFLFICLVIFLFNLIITFKVVRSCLSFV